MQGWVLKQGGRWPQGNDELCVHDGGEKNTFECMMMMVVMVRMMTNDDDAVTS